MFGKKEWRSAITKVGEGLANKEGVTIQSLERAFEILELFKQSKEMGISEISQGMGLSKSTVYGLVNTLVKYNYLEQDNSSKKYRLGMGLFEMGYLLKADLISEARQSLSVKSFPKNTGLPFIWQHIMKARLFILKNMTSPTT